MTTEAKEALLLKQIQREKQAFSKGAERFRQKASLSTFQQRFLHEFLEPLTESIKKRKQAISKQRGKAQLADFPIAALAEDELALITLMTIMYTLSTSHRNIDKKGKETEATLRRTAMKIGQHCRDQFFLELDEDIAQGNPECSADSRLKTILLARQSNKWNATRRTQEIIDAMKEPSWWNLARQIATGGTLIELAMKTTGLFAKTYVALGVDFEKKTAVLSLTPRGQEWLMMSQVDRRNKLHKTGTLAIPINLPTIIEPKPWTELRGGGYYKMPAVLVKKNGENFVHDEHYDMEQMPEVLSAVNSLQNTSWRINARLLELYKSYWDNADLRNKLFLPENEDELRPEVIASIETKIDTCESLLGQPFYFPYQLDFRGRIYAVPQIINNQADDSTRALIEFGKPEPVNEESEYWTAIHLANVYGLDKLTLDKRYAWCNENKHLIESVVSNPSNELKFWLVAEEPWAFLAAAYAWTDIKNGAKETYLPVYVDGRCNGLQHLSAMSRDEEAAKAVNVAFTDQPEDIYTRVAKKLEEIVAADTSPWATYWQGKIDRKIVKKPVMTTPYGVTPEGIKRQMKDAARKHHPSTPALIYLRDKVLIALQEAMSGPTAVKDWLQIIARKLAKENEPVIWTTPVGFKVVQDYRKPLFKRLSTKTFSVRYFLPVDGSRPANKRKQELGIIANFVHSMDAAHLIKVMNALEAEGINHVAVVHDSFGVHARHVGTMNRIIREQFLNIYSEPILDKFVDEQIQRTNIDLPRFKIYGNLDINEVLNSKYFFS